MYGDSDGDASLTKSNPARPCTGCGVPIGKGRFRWCSPACMDMWSLNHRYAQARHEALRCAEVFAIDGSHRWRVGYACRFCDAVTMDVEVDHIIAANGSHGQDSCLHHQENLRVLCRPCHRQRTREQRRNVA